MSIEDDIQRLSKRKAKPFMGTLNATSETKLKEQLTNKLRELYPGLVVFRHEDRFSFGIPDYSVSGRGKTTWWEAKHANPDFDSQGNQDLTMLRLAASTYARYIIWEEVGDIKRTLIVNPRQLKDWRFRWEEMFQGFDIKKLAEHIGKVHTP